MPLPHPPADHEVPPDGRDTPEGRELRDMLGLVKEEDVAAAFGVRDFTVAAWRRACTGPAYVKIGGRVFYRRDDIRAWVASNVVSSLPGGTFT